LYGLTTTFIVTSEIAIFNACPALDSQTGYAVATSMTRQRRASSGKFSIEQQYNAAKETQSFHIIKPK
jgi:hypothetical protein